VISGSCIAELNDSINAQSFKLNDPALSLLQPKLVWGHMHSLTSDCILLVLADTIYDPADYINEFSEFERDVIRSTNS
jgi:hypothetical protein